jgi:hypothetical protein
MINAINIPQTRQGITDAIAYRMNILAQWNAKIAKSRCKVRRHSRQLQADCTRAQIVQLRKALDQA